MNLISSAWESSSVFGWLRNKSKQKMNTHITNHNFQIKPSIGFRGPGLATNLTLLIFLEVLNKIPDILKYHSAKIVHNCVKHCEFVPAVRVRRTQQELSLYSKLWNESSLSELAKKFNTRLKCRKPFFLLGSGIVSAFDWDKERIPDEDILRYSAEMSLVEFLRYKMKACLKGASRPADCSCPVCGETDSEWQTFVEEDDIVVWKREDTDHRGQGLYCYKMYARYEDVAAYDFLEAQVDLDYRLGWDTHAVTLRLVDSEPHTNSDVIYWETRWPRLFSNRDYVFNRRFRIDKNRNLIFLVNRTTEHPSCPPVASKQRVSEYWSYMVIKPTTAFDKPGIEFSLTYFDNPGANVPSSLTLWATVSAMPEFLKKLRLAAQGVAKKRGGAPSPLAQRVSYVWSEEVADPEHAPTAARARLQESLRSTLFLF